ncbi:helix-turn-helix domain-containing protein [Patulibacter sp.]|uniref:helix-turn-helix domain-containing protein n=1 Tax=Patulibacter sp. TaxID=1912859 RepID=UPI002721AF0D|nr:helix-turn-helix domain-containing protein [Patulibacter sp.]MDO9407321.1 helix-turn-helix domain-containing protein [Patulibacter sp.]
MSDAPPDVSAALAELRTRLETLEAATGTADGAGPSATSGGGGAVGPEDDAPRRPGPAEAPRQRTPGSDPGTFWLLDGLARNTGPAFARDGVAGSVAYGGRVAAPGAGEVIWQMEHPVPAVVDADLDVAAATLAALGHPFRLRLLHRMLLGASTLAELQEPSGNGTTGQVHHHLRELRSAGLVVSRGRNHYAIPAERVVPVLVIVAAALGRDLGTTDPTEDEG